MSPAARLAGQVLPQCFLVLVFISTTGKVSAQSDDSPSPLPKWIWHATDSDLPPGGEEAVHLWKRFDIPGKLESAQLKVAADDSAEVFLNGQSLGELSVRSKEPTGPRYRAEVRDVASLLQPGENACLVAAKNRGGPYGFLLELKVVTEDGQRLTIRSDDTWLTTGAADDDKQITETWAAAEFDAASAGWKPALVVAEEGDNPWFQVLTPPAVAEGDALTLPEGFRAEVLRVAKEGEDTWVSLTRDDQGRFILGAQHAPSEEWGGLLRVTLSGDGQIATEERIELPVGAAQGLAYGFGALYVQGEGPEGLGIYRLTDSDGDDRYDTSEFLKEVFNRGGSHGPHSLTIGPDGWIYHVSGDYSKPVDALADSSPFQHYAEDLLLPRRWDATGHGRGVMAPCGHVQRFTPDGKTWELVCGGLRNPYGLAFNRDAELFTYDADMEYDIGLPWYRPTRVYHLVPGGDYGHREGTGKWPYYYPDSLPPITDIGLGSPCGVKFAYASHFPQPWKDALLMCDWAYGKIYAVFTEPDGATYRGDFKIFAEGKPLNAMDLAFADDGALIFITGGNDTQSALYRVTYTGKDKTEPTLSTSEESEGAAARKRRREMTYETAWDHLGDGDRWLRYASRVALETRPVEEWKARALAQDPKEPDATLTAMLALARLGSGEDLPELLTLLSRLDWPALSKPQKLSLLRTYQVAFSRLGPPDAKTRTALGNELNARFPAPDDAFDLNRELARLLVFLEHPDTIAKCLALVENAKTQEEEIHYITVLRNMKFGWTLEQRKQYFAWFDHAAANYRGGVSFYKYLANFKEDAVATLTEAERAALGEAIIANFETAPPAAPQIRPFVKAWTLAELEPHLEEVARGRDYSQGKAAFRDAMCLTCHRMFNEGGAIGPDLSAVASRFSRRDILEAILDPSKTVMEQYHNTSVTLKDGTTLNGRLIEETDDHLTLITDAATQQRTEVPLANIQSRQPSKISPMPPGLLNTLSQEDILNLLAFIEAGGSPGAPNFEK